MKIILTILAACVALVGLTGCNKYGDDCCEDCAPRSLHAGHSLINACNECVPAPAPMVESPSKEAPKVVVPLSEPKAREANAVAPVVKKVESVKTVQKATQIVENRRPEPAPLPPARKFRMGEIEIDDL